MRHVPSGRGEGDLELSAGSPEGDVPGLLQKITGNQRQKQVHHVPWHDHG